MNNLEKQLKAMEVSFNRKDLPKVWFNYNYTKINPIALDILKELVSYDRSLSIMFQKNVGDTHYDLIEIAYWVSGQVITYKLQLYYLPSLIVLVQKTVRFRGATSGIAVGKVLGWLESELPLKERN